MIDHTGRKLPSLFAMLHGGGGLPGANPADFADSRPLLRAANGKAARQKSVLDTESISLMPPNPSTQYAPGAGPGRRPSPACCTANRASSAQADRAWAVKPEAAPRWATASYGSGASSISTALVDPSKLRASPRPAGAASKLSTAKRHRPKIAPPVEQWTPAPPERQANTAGHARIAAVRRKNARGPRKAAGIDGRVTSAANSAAADGGAAGGAAATTNAAGASTSQPGSASSRGATPVETEGEVAVGHDAPTAAALLGAAVDIVVVEHDGGKPLVRVRVRHARESAAEATVREAAEHAAEEAEADEALERARETLRSNEAFFEEMRRRVEAEEGAAVAIQAGARGRKARATLAR